MAWAGGYVIAHSSSMIPAWWKAKVPCSRGFTQSPLLYRAEQLSTQLSLMSLGVPGAHTLVVVVVVAAAAVVGGGVEVVVVMGPVATYRCVRLMVSSPGSKK